MRLGSFFLLAATLGAQTIPTFDGTLTVNGQQYSYKMVGQKPESGTATTIPTVVVPVTVQFAGGKEMDASPVIAKLIHSPVFQSSSFANGKTQYGDALQRAEFGQTAASEWHTLLGRPTVAAAIRVEIPVANGYLLHSRRTRKALAVVDLDFVQKAVFAQLAGTGGSDKLVIFVTSDVAFYSLSDATVCCSVGTHGVLGAQAFVVASYFDAGVMPRYTDVQGISQQIGEWLNDPERNTKFPRWLKPPANLSCGGGGESSSYLLEQPADFVPGANAASLGRYHLENMALLAWFAQTPGTVYSFPAARALPSPAQPCSSGRAAYVPPTAAPLPGVTGVLKHKLIGYWEGYSSVRSPVPLRDVSPQWDIIITTFATPVKGSTSLLHFSPPAALGEEKFKADVGYLQGIGKKVLISLGGGGQVVTINTPQDLHDFVSSVTEIVEKYGFDGVDLDIETPSLLINARDTDFRHPTTPSIVNLITAMHQLHDHFGAKFMIAEVPEAAQAQSGMQVYGGQFGSFLPVIYGTRDILSFVDAQDYNTPPLEGLDGNYYFPGNADYHVAMSEMLVHGFAVAGNPRIMFPPLPAEQVAIGLPATPSSARNYTEIPAIEDALRYLIEGKPYAGAKYKLRRRMAYPRFMGAMFWAINEDRRNNYKMSNAIGGFLHSLP
jgi:chitinase